MQLGIIGLPQSGKTTLYKALTRADIATDMSTGQMEVHTSVVDVPDPRVDPLASALPAPLGEDDGVCRGGGCGSVCGWLLGIGGGPWLPARRGPRAAVDLEAGGPGS